MNKRILILSRREDRAAYDQKNTIEAAISGLETSNEYVVDEYEALTFVYDGADLSVLLSDGVTDVSDFDTVFFMAWFKTPILEDVALSAATYANAKGARVVNSEVLYTRSRSKLSQCVVAALNGIKTTPFIFSIDAAKLRSALESRWQAGFPIIMKGVRANRGNDNYLVKSLEEAVDTLASQVDEDGPWFIVQSFVPNNGDYRIIVMGNQVTAVIHRLAQDGTHLNNTSKGGTATYSPVDVLPKEVVEQSVRLSTLLRREITGVDMIQHAETGEFYLLEINNMPQLATGSFVENKFVQLDNYLGSI